MFLSQTTTKNTCPVAEHNTHELTHVLVREMVGVTNETNISWRDKQFTVIFLSNIFLPLQEFNSQENEVTLFSSLL